MTAIGSGTAWRTHFVIATTAFAGFAAEAAGRVVIVSYDFQKAEAERFQICAHEIPPDGSCGANSAAWVRNVHAFEIKASDTVLLEMTWAEGEDADIVFAVTGTGVDDGALEALRSVLGFPPRPPRVPTNPTSTLTPVSRTRTRRMTEELVAGGRLTVTFNIRADNQIVSTSGPLTLYIEREKPRLTVSNGIVVTTGPEPEVAIVKTATVVAFERDEVIQRAYERVVTLRGVESQVRPIQSIVTFLNFRLSWSLYGSLGFQLNQRLFEEPILGVTWRLDLGRVGVNATVGALLSRETEFVPASGFFPGYKIDPTADLTEDDIPTRMRYWARPALGFGLDF